MMVITVTTQAKASYEYNANNDIWDWLGQDIDGESKTSRIISVIECDGTIVAIATHNNGNNGDDSGHIRVYEYNGNRWNQLGEDIDGEVGIDRSGWSVSLSADGTRVAIGAYLNDGNTGNILDNRGHVRLYEFNGNNWNQFGLDIDGEAAGDISGSSVSLSADGTRVAIGAILMMVILVISRVM